MIVCTFDTETTGLLDNPMARVVEIGIVKHDIETGKIIDTAEFFVRPADAVIENQDWSIPERFCGIQKNQILECGMHHIDALKYFSSFVGDCLVYAWNLPFDQRMMMRMAEDSIVQTGSHKDAAIFLQDIRWGGCWQHLYAFSKSLTEHSQRRKNGDLKTISMKRTIGIEGWNTVQNHRALDDAMLAAKIGHKLFNQLNK
jgi:DNA polymerase III alpha subunit (gram-positive type)